MKIFRTAYIYLLLILTAVVCQNCHMVPFNGDLDGYWHVVKFEMRDFDGDTDQMVEVTPEGKYLGINLGIINLIPEPYWGSTGEIVYDKKADKVSVRFPYVDTPDKIKVLRDWGIDDPNATYDIVRLDRKEMILKNANSVLTCTRF